MYKAYILSQEGEVFALHATTRIRTSYPGKLSQTLVESKKIVSDNYTLHNATVNFEGIITSVRNATNPVERKDPQDLIRGLENLRKSKKGFTVYHISESEVLDNCFFEDLTYSQDSKNGVKGKSISVRVSFTACQARFAQAVEIEVVPSPPVFDRQEKQTRGSGITTEVEDTPKMVEVLQKVKEQTNETIEGLNR